MSAVTVGIDSEQPEEGTLFEEQYALATSPAFVQQVQMAAINAAIALMADPATDERLANYCATLLNSPRAVAANLAFGVAANPAVTEKSSNSDLQWTVNSLMAAYAGVRVKG